MLQCLETPRILARRLPTPRHLARPLNLLVDALPIHTSRLRMSRAQLQQVQLPKGPSRRKRRRKRRKQIGKMCRGQMEFDMMKSIRSMANESRQSLQPQQYYPPAPPLPPTQLAYPYMTSNHPFGGYSPQLTVAPAQPPSPTPPPRTQIGFEYSTSDDVSTAV